jgi:hypothetical protein
MRAVAACALLCLVGHLSVATLASAAETCPDPGSDDDPAQRRVRAKEWFAKAEAAEGAGDMQTAVRDYACSLKQVPHPSTAYDLGAAAEKAGDPSMAVYAFKVYLELASDAPDRAEVEARVARLEAQVEELRRRLEARTAETERPPALPVTPAPPPGAAPGVQPPPVAGAGGPAERPPPVRRRPYTLAGGLALGGGAAALAGGITLNLMARQKMTDCYRLAAQGAPNALDQCNAARPLAYTSYALFGAAAALAVAGTTLLFWTSDGGKSGGVTIAGRF